MNGSFPHGALVRLGRCSDPGNEESFNILLGELLRFSVFKFFKTILFITLTLRQGHEAV